MTYPVVLQVGYLVTFDGHVKAVHDKQHSVQQVNWEPRGYSFQSVA